jgi:hypothetical protein
LRLIAAFRDWRVLLLLGLFAAMQCGLASGLGWWLQQESDRGEAAGMVLPPEERDPAQTPSELRRIRELSELAGLDDEVDPLIVQAEEAELIAAEAGGQDEPLGDPVVRELEKLEEELEKPPAPAPRAPGRIEKITFHPEPEPEWEPPAWLIAGGIGGSIVMLGLVAAAMVWFRGGDE